MRIPCAVEAAFGSRAVVSVKGRINGFEFRSSVFPNGDGTHHMMVNKAMQKGAGAKAGQTVDVVMGPDTEERQVNVPADLRKAIAGMQALAKNGLRYPIPPYGIQDVPSAGMGRSYAGGAKPAASG